MASTFDFTVSSPASAGAERTHNLIGTLFGSPTTGTDLPYINMKRSDMVSASTILSFELEIWSISLSIEILWY